MSIWDTLTNSFFNRATLTPEKRRDLMGRSEGAVVELTETLDAFKLKLVLFAQDGPLDDGAYGLTIPKSVINSYDNPERATESLRNSISSQHLRVSVDKSDKVSFLAIDGAAVYNNYSAPAMESKPA